MQVDDPDVGSPRDWLKNARSDLALASSRKTKAVLYAHLCFHAQQAAEKALKAVLIHYGVRCRRTHDLAFLLEQLPTVVRIPPSLLDAPTLTKYAVQHRYPGEVPPITARQRKQAVVLAADAVQWATSHIAAFAEN